MTKINKVHKKLKIVLSTILVLLVIGGGAFEATNMFIKNKLSKIKTVDISKVPKDIGIRTLAVSKQNSITNILLLGVDSRDPNDADSRADSIMVLTIDKKNNNLKITSIMRDSWVNIDGHGQEKINAAYAYGGPLLSLKTVNESYNMNIMNYVQVDFFGLAKVIDSVGGVDINVTAAEVPLVNSYGSEVAKIEKKQLIPLTHPGLQTLSGSQAVAYSRIRYVGNNDFQRTERQRTVLSLLFKKLSTKKITDIPAVIDQFLPCVQTSLNTAQIMDFGEYILIRKMFSVEQSRVPYDGLYQNAVINGQDVLTWDKQQTIDKLHEFIFGSKGM